MDITLYGSFFIGAVFCFICGYEICKHKLKPEIRQLEQQRDIWRGQFQNAEFEIGAYEKAADAQAVVMTDLREERDNLKEELVLQKKVNETLIAESHQYREERDNLRAELAKVNDPETQRIVKMRKQMQQEQSAFNLLCNYGTELAYGQVSAGDIMGVKEGRAE